MVSAFGSEQYLYQNIYFPLDKETYVVIYCRENNQFIYSAILVYNFELTCLENICEIL